MQGHLSPRQTILCTKLSGSCGGTRLVMSKAFARCCHSLALMMARGIDADAHSCCAMSVTAWLASLCADIQHVMNQLREA